MSTYDNGSRVDMFIETKDEKVVILDKINSIIGIEILQVLQTDNLWQTILYGMHAVITTTNVNGYECYKINDFLSPYYLSGENKTEYDIDKETGLVMKSIVDETICTREYNFDNVNDDIFMEPDINQYTIKA